MHGTELSTARARLARSAVASRSVRHLRAACRRGVDLVALLPGKLRQPLLRSDSDIGFHIARHTSVDEVDSVTLASLRPRPAVCPVLSGRSRCGPHRDMNDERRARTDDHRLCLWGEHTLERRRCPAQAARETADLLVAECDAHDQRIDVLALARRERAALPVPATPSCVAEGGEGRWARAGELALPRCRFNARLIATSFSATLRPTTVGRGRRS